MRLLTEIKNFQPYTEQEKSAREKLFALLEQYGNKMLDRDCEAGHITCSGFILSPDLQETLMAYHLIYQSIGWTGGHADGNDDLLGVAIREAKEETSVTQIYPISRKILSIDILPVPAHQKYGNVIPEHLHYNITYGLIAPKNQAISDKPDENQNVHWLAIQEIKKQCTESNMIPIYEKIINRMQMIAEQKQAILAKLIQPLSDWYLENKRDLPWRKDQNPYHVWVSEIMLQQTRVEAVKNYYTRFLNALPNIQALANCPEEQLLKLWEGLGYYNRVRNMQKTAKFIIANYQGKFPETYQEIKALSGIGDYTAGAICSICYNLPTPAVDGNVLRVMARLQEDYRNILDLKCKADITKQLEKIYISPNTNCNILTQAFMELGAIVCIPNGSPKCGICPLNTLCMAKQNQSTSLLPVRIKKHKKRIVLKTVFILTCDNKIAIQKRPETGLLASLWELPNVENFLTPEQAIQQCSKWDIQPKEFIKITNKKHVFTHITWEMQGIFITCNQQSANFIWASPEELENIYSLPTAFRCLF
ncbi:MAG: A/G-specific adenine glycosylase [Oscillospiraceae bacterium]|nr:A/G-specific adenine glycosylase [Oscillospiraceae bacterium]